MSLPIRAESDSPGASIDLSLAKVDGGNVMDTRTAFADSGLVGMGMAYTSFAASRLNAVTMSCNISRNLSASPVSAQVRASGSLCMWSSRKSSMVSSRS